MSSVRINPVDEAEMVFIAAGEFLMGSEDGEASEKPQRAVYLDAYWIYKTPVTMAQYRAFWAFCKATGRQLLVDPSWGPDDHPIVEECWPDARAYCEWAGGSLPTEAQWEKAARGTDGREYPWGNAWDENRCHCSKRELLDAQGTAAVGRYPSGASPYGVLDMAGNVWEWCADWYDRDYYQRAPNCNPVGPDSSPEASTVIRGGSWVSNIPSTFRCASRNSVRSGSGRAANPSGAGPDVRTLDVGFRCVCRDAR